jgi:hypothetical protein
MPLPACQPVGQARTTSPLANSLLPLCLPFTAHRLLPRRCQVWATWARLNRRMEDHELHDVCLNPRRTRLYVDLSYK